MPFKIATWNINSVRLRISLVEKFLKEHQPDVLCLQEIKCQNDQFPEKNFRKLGYEHIAVHGQKAYHGVATVSKRPLSECASTDYCSMGDTRHLATSVNAGSSTLRVHNFYVPAGGDEPDVSKNPKFDHKLRFLDEMLALKANENGVDQILVGDLNIAPHPSDVWSHKQLLKIVSHTPIEVEHLAQAQDAGNWVDLTRQDIPEGQLYSWWSYRAKDWSGADKGRRLDHIWATQDIANAGHSSRIRRDVRGWEQPSDHAPVFASFDL